MMSTSPERLKIIVNFACVYLVWGSTYLGIKYAIVGFPPFLMASIRFIAASALLFLIGRFKREEKIPIADLKVAALSGSVAWVAVCRRTVDAANYRMFRCGFGGFVFGHSQTYKNANKEQLLGKKFQSFLHDFFMLCSLGASVPRVNVNVRKR